MKLFKSHSEKQIKRILPLAQSTDALADTFAAMSDGELRAYTDILKGKLAEGKTTDDILPEAFALVREADTRVLGKRPFFVQILGGILLHQGRIAEMKTGEGKTLVATMPAYLNALTGRGVHIVTVNEYLARCGCDEMGKVYAFLGMTTGLITAGQEPEEKRQAYAADITYGTNNEFGFDYLRDNMVVYKERMVQRGHVFAIVDEVDSILIDEARTPLIISGAGTDSTQMYDLADKLARRLRCHVIKEFDTKLDNDEYEEDYIVDEKARTAILTKHGIEKAERHFHIDNLSDPENNTIYHHVNTAIRAHGVMKRDVDYIVKDGNVVIVDTFTGRLMPGRRYNEGLHQAIEAKENVKIQKESRTLATITFQNYFRMYEKLSGMTGTALTESEEFREIYSLDVVEVPTNRPMIRIDHDDNVYRTRAGKMRAIVRQIAECHEKGQPVLVGTVSIDKSEELSSLLKRAGIAHTVLNAKHHEKEAEIVAQAGRLGAVTISTNMAGRGTDIMLGGNPEYMAKADMRKHGYAEDIILAATGIKETDDAVISEAREFFRQAVARHKEAIRPEADKVRAVGGLYILGTERHESRRIDNQLRGRSGRQGDEGESKFFLSMQDDLLRLFGSDRIMAITQRLGLDEDTPIRASILSGSIEGAQHKIESVNFSRRKNVLSYDDVMNHQRNVIYGQRRDVLFTEDMSQRIETMIRETVGEFFDENFPSDDTNEWNAEGFCAQFDGLLGSAKDIVSQSRDLGAMRQDAIDRAVALYHSKDALFARLEGMPKDAMREVEKVILLQNIDRNWMEHLDAMDDLKEHVGLNAYAQRDPMAMFRIQGGDLFDQLIGDIRAQTVRQVLCVVPRARATERVQVAKPLSTGAGAGTVRKPAASQKVGRNDPCPCGSGKKYKKCCGMQNSTHA